jgi:hypothetical protein
LKNSQNYKTIWVVIKFETHFQESVKNILLFKTFFGFRVLPGEKKKSCSSPTHKQLIVAHRLWQVQTNNNNNS